MRALILVAGAALAVSACSSNEPAEENMEVENLAVDNLVVNDPTALDAGTNMDANMATDMNMTTDANMTTDVNADANAADTNTM